MQHYYTKPCEKSVLNLNKIDRKLLHAATANLARTVAAPRPHSISKHYRNRTAHPEEETQTLSGFLKSLVFLNVL